MKKKTRIGPELHICPLCNQTIYTGKRSIDSIKIEFPDAIEGKMEVDHIDPIIAIEDSGKDKDWNRLINRMFCEEDNLQNICSICHKLKTALEKQERQEFLKKQKGKNSGEVD